MFWFKNMIDNLRLRMKNQEVISLKAENAELKTKVERYEGALKVFKHKKTENIYELVNPYTINVTNGENDGQIMVLYRKRGNFEHQLFVRDRDEFYRNFEALQEGE